MKDNREIKSWNDLKNEFKLEQRYILNECNLLTLYQVIRKTILNIQIFDCMFLSCHVCV